MCDKCLRSKVQVTDTGDLWCGWCGNYATAARRQREEEAAARRRTEEEATDRQRQEADARQAAKARHQQEAAALAKLRSDATWMVCVRCIRAELQVQIQITGDSRLWCRWCKRLTIPHATLTKRDLFRDINWCAVCAEEVARPVVRRGYAEWDEDGNECGWYTTSSCPRCGTKVQTKTVPNDRLPPPK